MPTFSQTGCIANVDILQVVFDIFLQLGKRIVEIWQVEARKPTKHLITIHCGFVMCELEPMACSNTSNTCLYYMHYNACMFCFGVLESVFLWAGDPIEFISP